MSLKDSFYYNINRIAPNFVNRKHKGIGHIITLHRVLPSEERKKYDFNRSLAITPEALSRFIEDYKVKGYQFISMDEVLEQINQPSKKWIALTIDDGYKDNLTNGIPVFEKHNIPVCIYIANCFPNGNTIYWWYYLEEYIKNNDKIDLQTIGINYTATIGEPKESYDIVRELLRKSDYHTHRTFAKDICKKNDELIKSDNLRFNLSWENVTKLSNHPLITIGSHSILHTSMAYTKNVEESIKDSINEIQSYINTEVKHFAYPYGSLDDLNQTTLQILKKIGLSSAVLNHSGSIFKEHAKAPFVLPRMGLTDETDPKRIDDLLNGALHFRMNGSEKLFSVKV